VNRRQSVGRWQRRKAADRTILVLFLVLPFILLAEVDTQAQEVGERQEVLAFSLAYVPRDALTFVAVRPAALLERPMFASVANGLKAMADDQLGFGIAPEDISVLSVLLLPGEAQDVGICFRVVARNREAADRFAASLGEAESRKTFSDHIYGILPSGMSVYRSDGNPCVLFSPQETTLRRCLAAGPRGATGAKWTAPFDGVAKCDGAAVVNTSLLRAGFSVQPLAQVLSGLYRQENRYGPSHSSYTALQLAPLWQRSEYALAELHAGKDLFLRVVSQSATEDEAKQVHSAVLTAISVARLALSRGRHAMVADENLDASMLGQLDLVDEILEQAVIARREAQVGLAARVGQEAAGRAAKLMLPAVQASRDASHRRRSLNNLKQIALAFHNYHDTYKTFPAAVQIGPKDIPHSWRVTILPYVEQQSLYDAYRQDEPWDSEHNKTILAQMPDVYRFPGDRSSSTNTSYFGFVGPEALFQENRGTRIRDIRDGTSNTLLVVESKHEVPWTKPEDLPFDPEKAALRPGGWYKTGFNVALCDGSTRFLHSDLEEQTLKYLIMRADGNPIRLE
jgi:hypothetical protein